MKRWWIIAKWLIKAGIAAWFLMLPLLPVYGWLRPWSKAEEALRRAGVVGRLLMVGSGSHIQHNWSNAGHVWREDEQRSYVVFPNLLRDWQVFTYFEVRGTGIDGTKAGIKTTSVFPLLVMWVLAGLFSLRTFRQLRRMASCDSEGASGGSPDGHALKPNKAPEPTPGAVTPRATEGTSQ